MSTDVNEASVESVVRPRVVWVFEVMDGPGTPEKPWKFDRYIAAEYLTESAEDARAFAEYEYGYTIRGSQRRELTFEEYCALLRCKADSEHGKKVWQAMLRIVFTGSLSSV
jgi:hypothetical protein